MIPYSAYIKGLENRFWVGKYLSKNNLDMGLSEEMKCLMSDS